MEKVDKNGVICLFSMFPSWVLVLKLFKKSHLKPVKAIYMYASASSHYACSENDMVYRALSHHSWE